MGWNFGDIMDAVAPAIPPEAPAFIHGERVINWGEANKAMNNMARGFIARGAKPGDKVAFYMRNCPEYLIAHRDADVAHRLLVIGIAQTGGFEIGPILLRAA